MGGGSPTDQNGPTKVGKYELRNVVGRGSIGVVYQGWDVVLKRVVAVKTFPLVELDTPLGQEKYRRFQREAQAAARLHHSNIAITFDYGETSSFAYIVMEFIEGPSLRGLLEHTRIGIDHIRHIMQGLLAGLQHSHDQGVVHRDIKPANILFNRNGQVKITDFGIAHLDDSDLTQIGSQVGTPAYMSPEQVLGDTADSRSDIYSAGVVLYEMLTGRRPFEGSTNSVMHKIVHALPPRVSESTTQFSPAVDAVVAKVLAKDQNDRYQTANEFWDALSTSLQSARHSGEPGVTPEASLESTIVRSNATATPIGAPEAAPAKMPARRARAGTLTSVAAVTCVALGAIVWWSVHKPGEEPAARSSLTLGTNQAVPAVHQEVAATPSARAPSSAAASGGADKPGVEAPPTNAAKPPAASQSTAANVPVGRSDLLAELGAVAARIPCSLVTARIGDSNSVILDGATALGEASELEIRGMVRQSIAQLTPNAAVTWNVRRVNGPFCPIFEILHPVAATTGPGLFIGVPGSGTEQSQDKTPTGQIRAIMPGFPGMLIMDAYSVDGLVYHLYPGAAVHTLPAGAEVPVNLSGMAGRNAVDQQPSLLVAIASSAALLDSPKSASEPVAAYLKYLAGALVRIRGTGASVLADSRGIGQDPPK